MMYKEIYNLGEERLYARFKERIDEIENDRQPVDYNPRFGYRYEEIEVDEDKIWNELVEKALNESFTDEEMYYAIVELENIENANDFWNEVIEYRRGTAA